MATAIVTKPSVPHQKMKRPPPPAVQTNGILPSRSSPSPSTGTKRPPSGFKHPPPTLIVNGTGLNGVGPRLSNRRRESQKPGDIQGRNRSGKVGQDSERKIPKRMSEPYVKSQAYILKKYRKAAPSFTIHLHPTNFRLDQSDGSFSYNSPMRAILQHLREQTVPHEMLEELHLNHVKFYEGCLIVQIHDHKNTSTSTKPNGTATKDNNVPFSIHNYNNFLTPSPYVRYPEPSDSKPTNLAEPRADAEGTSASSKGTEDKQNIACPKIYTVVLFSTELSLAEDVFLQANTPDIRSAHRKQAQASTVPRTPASATVPQTPLSAVPPTPALNGPSNKKQKMSISGADIHEYESKLIRSTAPPLFLEPAEDLYHSQGIIDSLTHPLNKQDHPAPKKRKRTVAELAQEEAEAAEEQAYMLIMDERLGPLVSSAGNIATTDGEVGIAPFEPRFGQFNVIQNIKASHHEQAKQKERQDAEAKANAAASKASHEQRVREQRAETMRRQEQSNHMQLLQIQQLELQSRELQRAQAIAVQTQLAHGHQNAASQAQHSSPVVRNMTPQNGSSPLVGNVQPGQAGPMNVTSSGQGATSSPARPPSAMQHPNGRGGVPMVHQRSGQQHLSRTSTPHLNGTPHMNGTPSMTHATPVMRRATPTTAMPQGSPPNAMTHTPVMNHNPTNNQHMNGQNMTPQQHAQHQAEMMQRRQQAIAQQQHIQAQLQSQQMSPNHNPQLQNLHHMAAQNQQRVQLEEVYRQAMANHHALSNGGQHGHPNMPNGASPTPPQQVHTQPHSQQHPNQGNPQQQQLRLNPAIAQRQNQIYQKHFAQHMQQLITKYGGNQANIPDPERQQAQQRAKQIANAQIQRQIQHHQQQQQQVRQQQMLQSMGMGGGSGGMGNLGQGGGLANQGMGVSGQGMNPQQQQAMMAQMAAMPHNGGNNNIGMNGMGGMQ